MCLFISFLAALEHVEFRGQGSGLSRMQCLRQCWTLNTRCQAGDQTCILVVRDPADSVSHDGNSIKFFT